VIVVGITGQVSSGKGEVCRIARDHFGAIVVSVDEMGHRVLERDDVLDELVIEHGTAVRAPDGSPDRRGIGRIVFSDPEHLDRFNKTIWPPLIDELEDTLARLREDDSAPSAAVDCALIGRWGVRSWFDSVLVVVADESVRFARLVSKDLSKTEARDRIARSAAAGPFEGDATIVNNGTVEELTEQVRQVWPDLTRKRHT
jgi:dephospho-CoA kinase